MSWTQINKTKLRTIHYWKNYRYDKKNPDAPSIEIVSYAAGEQRRIDIGWTDLAASASGVRAIAIDMPRGTSLSATKKYALNFMREVNAGKHGNTTKRPIFEL